MRYRYKLVRDYEAERQDRMDEIVRASVEQLGAKIDEVFANRQKIKASLATPPAQHMPGRG